MPSSENLREFIVQGARNMLGSPARNGLGEELHFEVTSESREETLTLVIGTHRLEKTWEEWNISEEAGAEEIYESLRDTLSAAGFCPTDPDFMSLLR